MSNMAVYFSASPTAHAAAPLHWTIRSQALDQAALAARWAQQRPWWNVAKPENVNMVTMARWYGRWMKMVRSDLSIMTCRSPCKSSPRWSCGFICSTFKKSWPFHGTSTHLPSAKIYLFAVALCMWRHGCVHPFLHAKGIWRRVGSLEIALTKQAKIYGKPRATIMNPRKLLDSGSPRAQNTSKYTINVCLQLISDRRLGTVFSIPRSWESWPVDCPSGSKEHWSSDPKPVDVRRVTLPMWVLWSFVKCMFNHSHLTEIPNPQKPESRIYVAKTSKAPKWNWVHPIMKLFKSNFDRALFRGHLALQTLNLAAQPHQRWAWKEDLEVPEFHVSNHKRTKSGANFMAPTIGKFLVLCRQTSTQQFPDSGEIHFHIKKNHEESKVK